MQITTIGIDLAKNMFQVHGANEHGRLMLTGDSRALGRLRVNIGASGREDARQYLDMLSELLRSLGRHTWP